MKHVLLTIALLAAGPVAAAGKTGSLNSNASFLLEPQGTAYSDLSADGSFNNFQIIDYNAGSINSDIALRVFPSNDGGYWVAGYHTGTGHGIDLAIAKLHPDGSLDTSYNGTGKKLVTTTLDGLVDVAQGIGDVLYFVGRRSISATDTDIKVYCVDSAGDLCADFGPGGSTVIALDLGDAGHLHDIPSRATFAFSNLYVVGNVDIGVGATNYAAFAIKLAGVSGTADTSFGNDLAHPGVFVNNVDTIANARDTATDVIAYSPTPFAVRLVMTGVVGQSGGQTDGIVFSVDGISGVRDNFLGELVYADLGDEKQDNATRVIRRRDGGIIVAGAARDDSASPVQYQLLMQAYGPDGLNDTNFGDNGKLHKLVASGYNVPFGLAERAGNRDIVVGLSIKDDLFGDSHFLQSVVQFGSSGNTQHAMAFLDLDSADGTTKSTSGLDLLLDDDNKVLTAGFRVWSDTDFDTDMVVARYIATDSIFADRFGGPSAD